MAVRLPPSQGSGFTLAKAVCLAFEDVNLLQFDTQLEKGLERLSLPLSGSRVTICRWNPQPCSSLNTSKEVDSRHMGMCTAKPGQYECLDTLQGQFYKPKAPPPQTILSSLWATPLREARKISRGGERMPSYPQAQPKLPSLPRPIVRKQSLCQETVYSWTPENARCIGLERRKSSLVCKHPEK